MRLAEDEVCCTRDQETLAELRLFRCEASASDDTLSLSEDGVSSRMLGRLGAVPYTN